MHGELARNATSKERFRRGIKKMSHLEHPNIAKILEGPSIDDGWHYCALPYFSRGDLHSQILNGGLSSEAALKVLFGAAEGLAYAHERSLIHRDVSPWNILLSDEGEGIVTDFDLVLGADTTGGTRTGALGRVAYVAPEAATDATKATEVSDVFGLGMTGVFCLTQADLTLEDWRNPNNTLKRLNIDRHVRRVLRRATDWEPNNRHKSMREFSQELRIALDASRSTDREWWRRTTHPNGVRILVVDDEKFIRDILADFLKMEGYTVDVAINTAEALRLTRANLPQVTFLDLRLGNEDGFDTLKQLLELYPKANVVMISGFATVEATIKSMKAGAKDFILKPFKVEEIVASAIEWQDE